MMVRVVGWDIPGGSRHGVIATTESVQLTDNLLRDPDGRVLAKFVSGAWVDSEGRVWSDITVGVHA